MFSRDVCVYCRQGADGPTRAGLSAARSRGRKGGRKPISIDDPRVRMAQKMHKDKKISIDEICNTLKISRASFYRYLSMSKKIATIKNAEKPVNVEVEEIA